MNEERTIEELSRDEFAPMRGEVQHRGTRVLAVPPNEPPAPIGIAPPDPRNVVSNFDTRPIGAYDFSIPVPGLWEVNTEAGTPVLVLVGQAPDGYTLVLRSVRVEFNPPVAASLVANDVTPDRVLEMRLLRNGAPIPHNKQEVRGPLGMFTWDTHQVYGMRESFGLQVSAPLNLEIPSAVGDDFAWVTATFEGTLIPSKSRPPEVEIASDPVIVREYAGPPVTVGAAAPL